MLPDVDAVASAADLLSGEACTVVAHASGRPWLFGHGSTGRFRMVAVGRTRLTVIGTCLITDRELTRQVERAVRHADYDVLTSLPGSHHVVVTGSAGVLVFGDVAGLRRVFTTQVAGVVVVASHADVLRRLVQAPVSRGWLAARLASPDMPNAVRESLSPFEGIRAIPAGHRLILDDGAARHEPYWSAPQPIAPLADGAPVFAEALTRAVAGRVSLADGPVGVQLSGGLDSTAVSCLAGNAIRDRAALLLVTTASISPGNDDLRWARQVADHLAPAEHLVIDAPEAPVFFDDLPNSMLAMDEPAPFTAAAARVRHVAGLLSARGVRVHLNGQGGDEVLLAPLAYLRDVLRANPRRGWRHLRGQAALRDMDLLRLGRSVLADSSYPQWLRGAAGTLRTELPAEAVAVDWEAQPLLAPWASRDAEELVRATILAAPPSAGASLSTHATLVRIRSTAYRAALYRDAMAGYGVPADFPFFDRAVLEAALAIRAWERTDPWQPKPLLRAAVAGAVPERLLARRTKAHYNDDIYRGWRANRHDVAELFENSRLAELGLIDIAVLRRCLDSFASSGMAPAFVTDTLACEVWLRSLAPPFTAPLEADHACTPRERVPGTGGIEYPGGRRDGVAR
ncbi:MAG: asparagine synthase-related protein [Pseudonocardiales bacterium]